MDLTDFLLARLAEDERVALATGPDPEWIRLDVDGFIRTGSGLSEVLLDDMERHIVRWDPARVLADVEAKRQIVARHRPVRFTDLNLGIEDATVCWVCHSRLDCPDDWDEAAEWPYPLVQDPYPCETLRLLAALPAYAAHPDYDPAWAVSP